MSINFFAQLYKDRTFCPPASLQKSLYKSRVKMKKPILQRTAEERRGMLGEPPVRARLYGEGRVGRVVAEGGATVLKQKK